MTINQLKSMMAATINPEDAASILGCNPQSIRIAARQNPELLGFPVIVMGNRVKIPRIPFIKLLEGGGETD